MIRRIIINGAFTLIVHFSFCQLTTSEVTVTEGTTTIIHDDLVIEGNLGIGATPEHKLDVNGNAEFGAGTSNLELIQSGTTFAIQHHNPYVAWNDISLNPHGGNVGIGTNSPTSKLDVNGSTKINGDLIVTGGVYSNNTAGVNVIPVNIALSANWQDTGIAYDDLSTGTYIIQVYAHDHFVGGGHFYEYYSGIMSWYSGTTNNPYSDEITLHRTGLSPNENRIYLRTQRQYVVDGGQVKLQIRANYSSGSTTYTFKFKKLI